MYQIIRGDQIADELIFEAFQKGFSDYMIQFEMDLEFFTGHFFGPEGNRRELSFVALHEETPVGVILGGFKTNEPVKTLRCGGMSIVPEHRGTGLADLLMEWHEKAARDNNCRQLALEVIKGNDRAIRFYEKNGYEKTYDMFYRIFRPDGQLAAGVEDSSHQELLTLREQDHSHLPWQGAFEYFEQLPCRYFAIEREGRTVAGVAATPNRIFYLYVHPDHRGKGHASKLLAHAAQSLDTEAMRLVFTNNSELLTFANHLKMERAEVSQYEMVKWLE